MPVGISLQTYPLALDNLQNISQIALQGRGASCALLLALVTVAVLQKPRYGLKNWLTDFTVVWQEEVEPEGWCGVGAGWTLPAFLKCFLNLSWLMYVWSKLLLVTDIQWVRCGNGYLVGSLEILFWNACEMMDPCWGSCTISQYSVGTFMKRWHGNICIFNLFDSSLSLC